ncbi:MAG: hypothetical protein IJN99_04155 [Clostridia bacterium]|nr:hypothetical protein [Clostridia bacterium]
MSLWYDVKKKGYAHDGKTSWIRSYVDKVIQAMRSEVATRFNSHFAGESGKHRASDIVCNDGRDVEASLQAEASARSNEAVALQNNINAEIQARQREDIALRNEINSEKLARGQAVESLEASAAAESNARQAEDSRLEERIDEEASAREAGLSLKVDKEDGKGLSANDYTTAEKTKLSGIETGAQKNAVTKVAGKTGAVTLSKTDVGLSNVDNTSDANKPVSTAVQAELTAISNTVSGKVDKVSGKGLSTNDYTTAEKTKLSGIEAGAQVNTVTKVAGKTGAVTLSKSDVGLSNVDNTADLYKPVSVPVQAALDLKSDIDDVLTKTNTNEYTPIDSYNPATKKYVDETVVNVSSGGTIDLSDYALRADLPNIKKKFSAPDGDYIATHLTVGASGVSNSTGCIMTGGRSYTEYYSGDLVAAKPHLLENASNTAIVGGMDNNIAYADGSADLSVILGGLSNQIQAKSSCIVCGENNRIEPHNHRSVIIGGKDNEIPFGDSYDKGFCGVILGGIGNIGNTGEVVMGKYNNGEETDIENALIIGNGSSATMRSNALRVTYNGEIYTSAGYGQEEKKIATEEYVNNLISTLEARIAALEA